MKTQLLIIDPQNDFCDIPGAALPVVGADADMRRLADFLSRQGQALQGITVTLDSHASVAVERTTFWCTGEGAEVPAFTRITPEDVLAGRYQARDPLQTEKVLSMLKTLSAQGHSGLVVWPVHCVTASWGHNIHSSLLQALNSWEYATQKAVTKVLKGEYPLTEHFGAFEAEVPDKDVASTCFNTTLARNLTEGVDRLVIAGQASSHCVAASFDQLVSYLSSRGIQGPELILLKDCMSAVSGFEQDALAFFERAQGRGARVMTTLELETQASTR